MEQILFSYGKERKFFDFMSSLKRRKGLALISHIDLDGVASARAVNEVLNAEYIKFIDYSDFNELLVEELKDSGVSHVVFTDLAIDRIEILLAIERFARVLIIDHHLVSKDLNSKKTIFFNSQGYCSAYLCYYLFFKVKDISKYDWLVACAALSDNLYTEIAPWLTETISNYGEKFTLDPSLRKKSLFWDRQLLLSLFLIYFKSDLKKAYERIPEKFEDLVNLKKYATEVFSEVRLALKKFEKEKVMFPRCYFWEIHSEFPIKELVINLLCSRMPEATLIVAERREGYFRFTARCRDGRVNVADFLKLAVQGFSGASAGGHAPAAGGYVLLQDAEAFVGRLKRL